MSRARTISPVSCAWYDARPLAAGTVRRIGCIGRRLADMRKMLTPHVRAIGRPAGPAQDDAVDPARVEGTPAALKSDLIQLMGQEQVLHRVSDLVRYASDASPYRYLPQVVVLPARRRRARDPGVLRPYRAARHVPRRRHEPERAVAVRRHPHRRPAALGAAWWSRTAEPGCGPAPERSWVMPMPSCGASGGAWGLTPPPPTWPRSAGSSPTTPAACAAPWSATPTTPCRR